MSYFIISSFAMPNAQGGADPKGTKGGPDYKGFYEKYVSDKRSEKEALQAKLSTKLTDAEKLNIERQIFSIEKEMFQLEANPAPQLNAVEQRIKDMKLDPAKENWLLNAAKNVTNQEEANALLDFVTDFNGATGDKDPAAPISLDTPSGEDGDKAIPVGFKATDITNPETRDMAKANVMELVTAIAAKGE